MQTEAFMKLRSVITEHTFKLFEKRKQVLMKQRLAAFKKQNWELYAAKINEASQNYMQLTAMEMEFALQQIDMSQENYMVAL